MQPWWAWETQIILKSYLTPNLNYEVKYITYVIKHNLIILI